MTANHMDRALDLAWEAAGGVAPRPPVGAVVVASNGKVAGEGSTEPRPGRHAEVVALQQAGDRARGGTMYCSLEPHSFHGAAPPCTTEIIRAGISRVVVALQDPNPQVNGSGVSALRDAGITVDLAEGPAQTERAAELVEGFARHIHTGRPFVVTKFAVSLDGRTATRTRDSQWITGPVARQHAHRLRHSADALVTGIGTVLADDPRLTERDEFGSPTGRPRLRVIVDSEARLPNNSRLFDEPGEILWAISERARPAFERPGLSLLRLPGNERGLDIRVLLSELGGRGCCTVLIEAGGQLIGSLFDAGLVDRVDAYIAPVVIGGADAPGPVAGSGAETLAEALRLERVRYSQVGGDMLVTGYVTRT